MVIRFTGLGWLGALLWFTVPGLALVIASNGSGGDPSLFLILFAVFNVLIGVPAHVLLGRRLNTRRTPQGPQRHADHSLMGMAVEHTAFWYPLWSLIALAVVAGRAGSSFGVWVIGIGGLVGFIGWLIWAMGRYQAMTTLQSSPDGEILRARAKAAATTPVGTPAGDQPAAVEIPARDRRHDPEFRQLLSERWAAYVDEVMEYLAPSGVGTGIVDGMPFTVFDTSIRAGGIRDQYESMRTVCLVELPVALPDVRLRPRLADDQERLLTDLVVAEEPPWNCDLLPRLVALSLLESGDDPTSELIAEADQPGLADALVTAEVIAESVRQGLIHWRVHNRDLIYVSFPGAKLRLTAAEAALVVTGLAAIARTLSVDVPHRPGS